MIGLWVARLSDAGKRLTQWHLVESEIQNRKVTKCGRQMATHEGSVLAPLVTPPSKDVACFWCLKHKDIPLPDGGELEVVA